MINLLLDLFFISQGHLLPEQQQKSACRVLTTGVISDGSLGLKKKKKDRHKTRHQIGRTAVPITVDNICRLTAEGELL